MLDTALLESEVNGEDSDHKFNNTTIEEMVVVGDDTTS